MAYPYNPTGAIPGQTYNQPRTKQQVYDHLNRMSKDDHYKMDTILWYKTLIDTNTTLIQENTSRRPRRRSPAKGREFCRRLFGLLYYNGVLIRRQGQWVLWNTTNMPISAVLSHGGRILIQISYHNNCWPLLWGKNNEADAEEEAKPYRRKAATHGIGQMKSLNVINVNGYHCKKGIMELKGGIKTLFKNVPAISETKGRMAAGVPGKHYGINVAIGGTRNYNPFSGNRISANGAHGHLYVFYAPPPTTSKHGGLLIGLEDSAAPDVGPITVGQTFHAHTFGSTEDYLATGGKKWDSRRNPVGGVNESDWHQEGPLDRYSSLFVDVVGTNMVRLRRWINDFDPAIMLGRHGNENPTVIRVAHDDTFIPRLLTKRSPEWQRDSAYRICHNTPCDTRLRKGHRHHCRLCGHIFCNDHCPTRPRGVRGTTSGAVRICSDCYRNFTPITVEWTPDSHGQCEICENNVRKGTRHHCRNCGILICGPCSTNRFIIPGSGSNKKQRVCNNCYDALR